MASQEEFDALKGRIEELELKLQGAAAAASAPAASALTAEELQAFVKVRDVIAADWGENCGINECFKPRLCWRCTVCTTCSVCRACAVCVNECTCGPCNNGPMIPGGFERFGGLGG
ncbi:MAG: hypothetical protein WAS07_02935 [Micropruina sp.]|nr:hypothetical protein [Micropruina sp.]